MNLVNTISTVEKRDLRRLGYTVTDASNSRVISGGTNDKYVIKRLGRRKNARLRALGFSTVTPAT